MMEMCWGPSNQGPSEGISTTYKEGLLRLQSPKEASVSYILVGNLGTLPVSGKLKVFYNDYLICSPRQPVNK